MMKKLFLLLFCYGCFVSTTVIGQSTEGTLPKPSTDYLKRSKVQRNVGEALILTGAAVLLTSVVISKGEVIEEYGPSWFGPGYQVHKNDALKRNLAKAGVVTMLSSIPFFMLASNSKKKAVNMTGLLQMERLPVTHITGLSNRLRPALTFRLQWQ